VRRLEACAGIVERLNADHWRIPDDFEQRAGLRRLPHGAARRPRAVADRARRPDDDQRHLARPQPDQPRAGFSREVMDAMGHPRQWLIEQGFMREESNRYIYRRSMLAELAQRE
jgi:hypothetical protein